MLKKIEVKNYKGFNETLKLDLSKINKYTFNEYAIKNDLVNTGIIYGKNASGKSNLGLAIFDLVFHLTDFNKSEIQRLNYLNGNSPAEYADFVYTFLIAGIEIKYSYKKRSVDKLYYEELFIGKEKIFSYNFDNKMGDFSGMSLIKAETLNTDKIANISVLRFIAYNTALEEKNPISKLMNFINKMLWFRTTTTQNEYIGFRTGSDVLTKTIIKLNKVEDFQEFLKENEIDLNIYADRAPDNEEILMIKFANKGLNFMNAASHGTRALLLYYYWLLNFEEASFVFIDEFDAFFHTELGEKLILDLAKKQKTQLFITTHNTNLMSNNILRPDCYFIICNNNIVSLPNATDRELREGHNLQKLYLSGAFNEG